MAERVGRLPVGGPRDPPAGTGKMKRAVVISDRGEHQDGLRLAGYDVTYLAYTQLCSASASHHLEQMRLGEYVLIWIIPPTKRNMDKMGASATRARCNVIAQWVRIAKRSNIPAVLFGPVGPWWQEGFLYDLPTEGTVTQSLHHWCYYDVTLWKERVGGPRDLPSARNAQDA